MRFIKHNVTFIITTLFLVALAAPAFALDAPHSDAKGVACNSCHSHWNDPPDSDLDGTTMNKLCQSCHYAGGPATAKLTHSGFTTNSETTYGDNWTTQCIDCHDPHYQQQSIAYRTDYSAGGAFLETALIGSFAQNGGITNVIIANTDPGWAVDKWAGYSVVVGSSRLLTYRVESNTSNSVTLATSALGMRTGARYAQPGDPFRFVYGKLIRTQVRAPRPVINSSGVLYNASMYRDVMFFNTSNIHSPAVYLGDDKAICVVCHTRTKAFNYGYVLAGNSFDSQVSDYYNQQHKDRVSDDVNKSCWSSNSCHEAPAKGFDANCAGCHGFPPTTLAELINTTATGRTTTGAHAAHSTKGVQDCDYCHAGGGPNAPVGTDEHSVALKLTMGFTHGLNQGTYTAAALGPGYAFINGTNVTINTTGGPGTCNNIYCHSDGTGAAGVFQPVDWNAGPLACDSCHDGAGAATTLSPAHGKHTTLYGCADCHSDTASNNTAIKAGTGITKHVNATKDVVIIANGGTRDDYSSGSKTCSTLNCHGSSSPAWDTDFTGIDPCTRCHGETVSGSATDAQKAPGGAGTDTNGDSSASDAQVGAHQVHLGSTSNYSEDVACSECHNVPGTVTEAGHIDNALPGDVNFGTLATKGGVLSPTYSGGVCTNVYCHGGGMPNQSDSGLDPTPVWSDVAYLNGTPNIAGGDCDKCHGSPPSGASYSPNSHSGSEGIGDCNGCHSHINVDGSIANTVLHINGSIEASGCTGCHGQPPVDAATIVKSPDYTGHDEGAHQYHWTKFSTSSEKCNLCHTGGGGGGHQSLKQVTMGFSFTGNTGGNYASTAFSNGFGLRSSDGVTTVQEGTGARTCANIYCHSDGGNYAGTFTNATADWDATFSFPADCDKCHGNGSGQKVVTNVHPKHVSTYGFDCNICHSGTVDPNFVLAAGTWHVNGIKNVSFYSGTLANGGNYGRPNCSTVFCHSQGRTPYAAPNNTPAWNDTPGSFGCTDCHNNNQASGTPMVSGTHTSHINNSSTIGTNYECSTCHIGTLDSGNDGAIGTGKIANHVNGQRDVVGSLIGSYNEPADTCSNVYCHSSGQATPTYRTVATWGSGTNYDCKACHGADTDLASVAGEPNYSNGGTGVNNSNSHQKHVSAASDCTKCHDDTTNNGTQILGTGRHTDGSRDVAVNSAYDTNAGTKYDNYNTGTKTCSSISCHGVGTPQWGGTVSCEDCHSAADNDVDDFTYNNATTAAINSTEWTGYGHGATAGDLPLACTDCHSSGSSHGDTANPFRLLKTDNNACFDCHGTGSAGVNGKNGLVKVDKFHQMGKHTESGNNGGKFCWDCHDPHGDGSNIKMVQARAAWKTDGTYGNPGTLANLTAGGAGVIVFTDNTKGTGAGAFGVNTTQNGGGTPYTKGVCNACHTYSASTPEMIYYTSTSSSDHNQGAVCTTCHQHSGNTTKDGNAFQGAGDCDSCHGYPPVSGDGINSYDTTAEGKGTGAHELHVAHLETVKGITRDKTANYGAGVNATLCGTCHTNDNTNEHMKNSRLINFGDGFWNGTANSGYQFGSGPAYYKGTEGSTEATSTFKSCSNVSCHFKESPGWHNPATPGP